MFTNPYKSPCGGKIYRRIAGNRGFLPYQYQYQDEGYTGTDPELRLRRGEGLYSMRSDPDTLDLIRSAAHMPATSGLDDAEAIGQLQLIWPEDFDAEDLGKQVRGGFFWTKLRSYLRSSFHTTFLQASPLLSD